jgi:phosphoribosylanthranilate isomerase
MNVKVKICGITNKDDAFAAVDAGADALGFVFYEKSPRFVKRTVAADICALLPPFISKVGVFVDELEYEIERALADCGLDTLQFHGDEPPGFCQKFPAKSIKAFRMKDAQVLSRMEEYDVDAWLLDAFVEGKQGGAGQTFNWDWAREAKRFNVPIILSGGLTPENVGEAIRNVQPYAVDVSSGVEKEAGKKDHNKIKHFIEAVRNA